MKNYHQKHQQNKERRKPVDNNFAPKRLAINFDPPMIIMQYLTIDTGKLYHHKMRLDSILRKPNVVRQQVLNYIKNKHYLYFVSGKITDELLFKFIDKILLREGKLKRQPSISQPQNQVAEEYKKNPKDQFYFMNQDQDQYYEEDYEDYEQPNQKPQTKNLPPSKPRNEEQVRNAYLEYCRNYEKQEEDEGQAQWDLDMDEDADFV